MKIFLVLFLFVFGGFNLNAQCTACGGCAFGSEDSGLEIQQVEDVQKKMPQNMISHVGFLDGNEWTTISGEVIQKSAGVKSKEAWNAPSDPYFVVKFKDVDGSDRSYVLRPSESVKTEEIAEFLGKTVTINGYYTDGEPYVPENEFESYPTETIMIKDSKTGEMISKTVPAKRGSGFVVDSIKSK